MLKRQGVPLIALTGGLQSSLARHADVVLDCSVDKEACPRIWPPPPAPRPSWPWVTRCRGLARCPGFKPEDFARSHPGGSLGRKLLTHVADVMRKVTRCRKSGQMPNSLP